MGGKALKNAETRRFSKEEYHPFASDLKIRLRRILEGSRVEVVPAYRDKPDFGDADVLISTDALPPDWTDRVAREFLPTETVRNGGVFSFDHAGLQVDLIGAPESSYAFHLAYLSWNESGNIVGRIAHKAGLKYGHDGLHFVVRADGDPEGPSRSVLLTLDHDEALSFLGCDPVRFRAGFNTLDEVFAWALESPLLFPSSFFGGGEGGVEARRRSRRSGHEAFVALLEQMDADGAFLGREPPDKDAVRARAVERFGAQAAVSEAKDGLLAALSAKRRFNGTDVAAWTGLSGKELGGLMAAWRDRIGRGADADRRIAAMEPDEIRSSVLDLFASRGGRAP